MAENIIKRPIEDELKTSYLNYAMSVIISRALPDVRDGLKPVHRRILFSMHKLGMLYNKPFKKCATVVGDVLGKYHPHGDQAIYDTLVRLAQDFSLRYPLVDGQGNFGSIDGDGAAAMRYTEARMDRLADEMLKDISKETIDFQNNFDDSLKEPIVLPAAVPNLLINGVSGIAVGMATNIPPHNLREVVGAVKHYIDNNDCTIKDLMHYIKAPDFPTGGIIYGVDNIRKGYKTGKSIFKLQGKVSIEEFKKGREAIIITEIPYMVNKAEFIKKIASHVKNETIKGITSDGIRDESNKDGIRIVIELKRDVNAQTILNQLYKHTQLENSVSINAIAIVNNAPRTLNLKEIITNFVIHRFEVTTRRIKYDLKKAEERAHILEGLIKAVNNIDEVVKIIRTSKTVEDAKNNLIKAFSFSEAQSQAILDMRLARLVALEIQKLQDEYDSLIKLIAELKDLLAHPEKIYNLIKEELDTIAQKYGDDRKTEIKYELREELDEEDYIQKANVVISLTKAGYIKRTPVSVYKRQGRGGVGVKSTNTSQEDIISLLFVATTHDTIMFISNKGKAYYLKTHEIPEGSRTARGSHIKLLIGLEAGEEIYGYLAFESFNQDKNFIMVTANGTVKKCHIQDFVNAKKRGIVALKLKNNDVLVAAAEIDQGKDIVITSRHGQLLRTNAKLIRTMGRSAAGVRGMKLAQSDEVVGLEVVQNNVDLFFVTEKGYGKKLSFSEFSTKGRGGKGQICLKVNDKSGEIAAVKTVTEEDNILIISSSGQLIRLTSKVISRFGRTATGTRLVNVKPPDFIVDAAVIHPIETD
jgi:DNA gyrase subunit A